MPALDLNRWIADLGTALHRAIRPEPQISDAAYRTGTAMLAFTVEPDGGIADIRIVAGSGDAALDRRAIAKLRRAEPLPAGPDGATRRSQVAVVSVAEPVVAAAEPRRERAFA